MAEPEEQPREYRDAVMQRVRVGITGLAAVFLLTLLAASLFSLLGPADHSAKLANGTVVANAQMTPDLPKEPLAELGVAPGANPKPTIVQMPPPQITGNPPMVTLSPPAPVLSNQSAPATPAHH